MTARRTLDKALADVTYRRIIERGPWASYGKCWECGAEAGNCCVGDDGKEALEVCDGRRLVIDDSAARCRAPKGPTRRDKPPSTTADRLYRRRTGRSGEPQYAPCQHCGEPARLWGRAIETGHTWCNKPECQYVHHRARRNAQRARQRERIAASQRPDLAAAE